MLLSVILAWTFPEIVEKVPDGPFCYPGKFPREVIVVNPNHSPLLNTATQTLISRIQNDMSVIEVLAITMQFVKEELFDPKNSHEEIIQELTRQFPGEEPEISMEVFLREKTGNCRHIALISTYLLDQLVKQKILSGTVLLIREEIPRGRHAWTLFLHENSAWYLDISLDILEDGKTFKGFTKLCQLYGKEVMNKQKKQWE